MTIPGKMVANLTNKEAEHGLTHAMFSRVRKFSDIGLKDGIALHRLCHVIRKQSKMKKRIEEEKRLKKLADATVAKYFSQK